MHVAVAALKAEFSWPSLSFVVRHSKKCLTHLELLRQLDEGGAFIYNFLQAKNVF